MRRLIPQGIVLAASLVFAPAARACLTCSAHAFAPDPPAGNQIFYRSTPAAQSVTVHVINFDYSTNPAGQPIVDPTIFAGDTIHWQWDTGIVHDVKSVSTSLEQYSSGALNLGQTFDYTFNTPGTFVYYCSYHGSDNGNGTTNGMAGKITVLPVPEPASLGIAILMTSAAMLRRRR